MGLGQVRGSRQLALFGLGDQRVCASLCDVCVLHLPMVILYVHIELTTFLFKIESVASRKRGTSSGCEPHQTDSCANAAGAYCTQTPALLAHALEQRKSTRRQQASCRGHLLVRSPKFCLEAHLTYTHNTV